jgi:hypothetical protein
MVLVLERLTGEYQRATIKLCTDNEKVVKAMEADHAPYAPADNVISVISRIREGGIPNPLTAKQMVRLSIPEGNASRVLQTIRFLELIDDEGGHTEQLERIKRSSSQDYPLVLSDILKASYKDVFAIIPNPDGTPLDRLEDAFRHYEPSKQRGRMVSLFIKLCQTAGIITTIEQQGSRVTRKPRSPQPNGRNGTGTGRPTKPEAPPSQSAEKQAFATHAVSNYALLEVILQQLPPQRQWTQTRREKWLQAFTTSVDLLIDVLPETDEPKMTE